MVSLLCGRDLGGRERLGEVPGCAREGPSLLIPLNPEIVALVSLFLVSHAPGRLFIFSSICQAMNSSTMFFDKKNLS